MLILSRQRDERIMIGDDIVITVLDILAGGKVRLGIDAPQDMRVDREEVRQRIRREGERR